MPSRLKHIAIAVPDLTTAAELYRDLLGAEVSDPVAQADHGVNVVFVTLPNARIELITPLGENSPIAGFLQKNPRGGLHHLCFSAESAKDKAIYAEDQGIHVLAGGEPKPGAHGKDVIFLNPGDTGGTLIEFEED